MPINNIEAKGAPAEMLPWIREIEAKVAQMEQALIRAGVKM